MTTELRQTYPMMMPQQFGFNPNEMKKQRTVKQPIMPKEKKAEEMKPKISPIVTQNNQKKTCKLTHYNLNRFNYFSLTRGIVNERINDWIKENDNENTVVPDFCYIKMSPMFNY